MSVIVPSPSPQTSLIPKDLSQLRADRLKLARKLTGLTLDEIPAKFGISKHTFYAWESGRNPIREKSVPKIINAFRQVGIYCSHDWLMQGIGLSPRFMYEVSAASDLLHKNRDETPEEWEQFYDEMAIFSEIKVFQKVNKNTDVKFISDDAMAPWFGPGEYVGGICYFGDDILEKAINANCIIETQTGECYIRHLSKGKKEGLYNLTCLNPHANVSDLILYNVGLLSAAPIIWHRKIPNS